MCLIPGDFEIAKFKLELSFGKGLPLCRLRLRNQVRPMKATMSISRLESTQEARPTPPHSPVSGPWTAIFPRALEDECEASIPYLFQ